MKRIHKIFIMLAVFGIILSEFSSHSAYGLTVKEEEELSRQVMSVVFKYYELVEDPIVVEYVNTIGNQLVSYLPERLFNYHFYVVKTDSYNAFATPAGHIFINSGLFLAMEQEEELAGILAHEIAHVYCRHISQAIERSKKIGMATLAGMAAGVLLGAATGEAEAGEALAKGSMAAGQSAQLAYSRENEIQSDQLGLAYMTKAGYSGEGLLKILKKIRSKQWFGSDVVPTYLTTHPAVEDRIAYIGTWLAAQSEKSGPKSKVNNDNFERVHTLLLTRYGDQDTAFANLEAAVSAHPEDPQAHYQYGLILAQMGRRDEAIRHIKMALEKRAFDPYILNDLGRIYYLDGQYQKAISILESVYSIKPDYSECLLYLGRTQMELGQFKAATDYFRQLIEKHPGYKEGFYFLGQSSGKEGNLADAHYFLGIYYIKKRDGKSAVMHFKRALKYTNDADRRQEIEKILAKLDKATSGKKK